MKGLKPKPRDRSAQGPGSSTQILTYSAQKDRKENETNNPV
jgi:hypothetical protein